MVKEIFVKLWVIIEILMIKIDGLNVMLNGDLFGMESVNGLDDCKYDSVDEKSFGLGMELLYLEFCEDIVNGDKLLFVYECLVNLFGL